MLKLLEVLARLLAAAVLVVALMAACAVYLVVAVPYLAAVVAESIARGLVEATGSAIERVAGVDPSSQP